MKKKAKKGIIRGLHALLHRLIFWLSRALTWRYLWSPGDVCAHLDMVCGHMEVVYSNKEVVYGHMEDL